MRPAVVATQARPEPEAVLAELRLEVRLQDELDRLLNQAITLAVCGYHFRKVAELHGM